MHELLFVPKKNTFIKLLYTVPWLPTQNCFLQYGAPSFLVCRFTSNEPTKNSGAQRRIVYTKSSVDHPHNSIPLSEHRQMYLPRTRVSEPQLAVGFVGLLIFLFMLLFCFGVRKLQTRYAKQSPQPQQDVQRHETRPSPMRYERQSTLVDQLPVYEEAPPAYEEISRPDEAHVALR